MNPNFLADMQARGLVQQSSSPALADALQRGGVVGYIGFDPTADSLHVGSLTQLLNLARLQRAGHRPIAVVGGGTGLIGDPSGKESERTLLTHDALARNLAGIRRQVEQYLDLSPGAGLVLNNAEWLCELNLVEFLRDIGKHFSVNQMMVRDSVRTRLETREQGLSYTEFTYMLLQAYDFLALHDRHGCTLQMGATDQWGNILSGADLVRRLRGVEVFGLTTPLVTRADGKKFGKSEEGNVWLDPQRTSPYQFYQFWLNADDADVERYLKTFTFLSVEEIGDLVAAHQRNPQERSGQRVLAEQVTRLAHGDAALQRAQRTTAALFSKDADYRELSESELRDAFQGAPTTDLPRSTLGTADALLVALAADAGLYPSRGQARKDMPAGALSINNVATTDANRTVGPEDVLAGGYVVLRKGRKNFHVLRVVEG